MSEDNNKQEEKVVVQISEELAESKCAVDGCDEPANPETGVCPKHHEFAYSALFF